MSVLRGCVLAVCLASCACGGASPSTPSAPTSAEPPGSTSPSPAPPVSIPIPVPDATLVGAGDIVKCNSPDAEATAQLLDGIPGTVVSLGDNVYPSATAELLARCFTPTWGRHLSRMLAVPGNHDWEVSAGAPFFAYFGAAAGPAGRGYFSTTLGTWHLVILNSNVPAGAGTAQYEWLKADLEAVNVPCTIALWHHPMFSSGENGDSVQMREAWRLLHSRGADIVLNGHDHDYERFAPQDADGRADPRGIREFVVGTGGGSLYDRVRPQPNAEAFENRTFGVLQLTLKTKAYDWRFVPVAGQQYSDSGTGACVM